jgi:hypothetical protein
VELRWTLFQKWNNNGIWMYACLRIELQKTRGKQTLGPELLTKTRTKRPPPCRATTRGDCVEICAYSCLY